MDPELKNQKLTSELMKDIAGRNVLFDVIVHGRRNKTELLDYVLFLPKDGKHIIQALIKVRIYVGEKKKSVQINIVPFIDKYKRDPTVAKKVTAVYGKGQILATVEGEPGGILITIKPSFELCVPSLFSYKCIYSQYIPDYSKGPEMIEEIRKSMLASDLMKSLKSELLLDVIEFLESKKNFETGIEIQELEKILDK